jgi:hypothetical protein
MSDFTPGPWLLRTTPTSAGLCHIVSAADWRGAFIYGDGIRKGVDDALPKAQELAANARLIAAAPDLLEALREMVAGDAEAIEDAERIGIPFPDEMLATYNKACAAIAKATGERP